jgi:hypothetical protein
VQSNIVRVEVFGVEAVSHTFLGRPSIGCARRRYGEGRG